MMALSWTRPPMEEAPAERCGSWRNSFYSLVEMCLPILSERALFFLLNSYTTGLSPAVMEYLLGTLLQKKLGGQVSSDEIGLPVTSTGLVLPCGSTAIWESSY